MTKKVYDVLIVGTGAAGYSTADWLYRYNIKNIAIVTENKLLGTSRNAGSDKQTYYKLSMSSGECDSVEKMASDLYQSGSMSGEDAYIEASNSARCFMRLVELGVPFPTNKYGEYVGYKTDNDDTSRATSAGPLTSKYIVNALEREVLSHKIDIINNAFVVKLIVKNNSIHGIKYLQNGKLTTLFCKNLVLCTGAPSAVYHDSVYPVGQTGASGLAIEVGAKMSNFQEWQYGIASIKFRWNLSGSYQQVIPRYISVDKNGTEREFLIEKMSYQEAFNNTFLKGYEWPFDFKKSHYSSAIDLAVCDELDRGNRVYLDFTKNPSNFDFNSLFYEGREYLRSANAICDTPYDRLKTLNPKAIKIFLDHGIDLSTDKLEIAVCAQHNNGGIWTDSYSMSSVNRLFVVGEAAGKFGVHRPGGAALNSTQVGGLRVAEYLHMYGIGEDVDVISDDSMQDFFDWNGYDKKTSITENEKTFNYLDNDEIEQYQEYFSSAMSRVCGIKRDREKISDLLQELNNFYNKLCLLRINKKNASMLCKLRLTLLAQITLCRTVIFSIDNIGSRGGCICYSNNKIVVNNDAAYNKITITEKDKVYFIEANKPVRQNENFEMLLKEKDIYHGGYKL